MSKQRVRPGDILELPLSDGRFAYGKILRDATIAIYDIVAPERMKPPFAQRYRFMVGVYRDVVTSGKWPRVGHEPFATPEDEWPAPTSVKDPIGGQWQVYFHAELRPSTTEECALLEPAAVWDEQHIIYRILDTPPN